MAPDNLSRQTTCSTTCSTNSAPDNLSRVLWLPSLVFSLDPRSFLRVQLLSRAYRDEKDSVVAAWYWRRMILVQLPGAGEDAFQKITSVGLSKCSVSNLFVDTTDAAEWRQVFFEFDSHFVNSALMSTDAEYQQFYTSKARAAVLSHGGAPPDLLFASLPANSCKLRPSRSLGGDRIVIGSRPFPRAVSCTGIRREDGWRLGYRVVHGYFEVELGPSSADEEFEARPPCVSVGLCTSDILPKSVMSKQVGWCKHSWGLHGDDGQLYHATGVGAPLSPYCLADLMRNVRRPMESNSEEARFGAGDVIGCGVVMLPKDDSEESQHLDQGVFFTKNGKFLGVAFLIKGALRRDLYPCTGIDAHWTVSFNFGARPFAFDVDSLGHVAVPELRRRGTASASASRLLGAPSASEPPRSHGIERLVAVERLRAAFKLIRRAAKSVAWMRRRGRDLVHPFMGAGHTPAREELA